MLKPSTIQLLRIPFSFFLLPVYLFALSQVPDIDWADALQIFILLHVLVYPSSNGYNSYMDRDEMPVGGIEKPMAPTRELFVVSVVLDIAALLWGLCISLPFFIGLLAYILASRAYSFRGIRLKQYPIVGYLTVCIFQGAVTYFMVYHGSSVSKTLQCPVLALVGASLLMGSFYPLTQVYQHEADRKDNVKTISRLLGIRGTFVYTALVYSIAMGVLFLYFREQQKENLFLLMALLLLPVLVFFFYWALKVWKNAAAADFRHTMRMNWLASACSNLVFSLLILIRYFE